MNDYDKGGVIPPGPTWVRNDSGEDIPVSTVESLAAQIKWAQDRIRERYQDDGA